MVRTLGVMLAMALAPLAATPRAQAQDAADPTVTMVTYIDVAPAAKDEAAPLFRQLAEASRKDAGVLRFEVLQRTAPANQFVILAAWKDQAAVDAHAATAHAKQFLEKLNPLLIAPVDDRPCVTFHVGASQPVPAGALYVVTHVDVPGNVRDKILGPLRTLADTTRKEAGNLRFDVVYQKARTNHFTMVEAWKDQASDDTHELAAHTRDFRNVLTPITGALYDQRWYKAL